MYRVIKLCFIESECNTWELGSALEARKNAMISAFDSTL